MPFELVFGVDFKSEKGIFIFGYSSYYGCFNFPTLKQGLMKLASNRMFYISSGHKFYEDSESEVRIPNLWLC
jgi:hypothetical protein